MKHLRYHKNLLAVCVYIILMFILNHSENRGEFLEKLQRARAAVRQGTTSQPILTTPGTLRIVVGNWVLNSQKEQHLHINNSEGHQVRLHQIMKRESNKKLKPCLQSLGHNLAR